MFGRGSGLQRIVRVVHCQQVRWKRKDGHRYHLKERPPTKKQRKRFNRSKNVGKKHGVPGSKAGPRRETEQRRIQNILNPAPDPLALEEDVYTKDHALLDDLMGNTKAFQPNPVPSFYGSQQRKYFNKVADQLEEFKRLSSSTEPTEGSLPTMPKDKDISLALRAFRDRNGTHRQPVGLVKALRHLVQDLQLPVSCFGEYTYTSILTCCASPAEGRRVIDLQRKHDHPVSSYSWSILVDLHSKVADWKGCVDTHAEMLENGVSPTLASYTSLISACAATCRNGRVPHSIRAKAGEVAFENWQDLQIIGFEPDAMAYGSILSVYAARGQGEKAIALLEEMPQRDVLPTSFAFRQGLVAVARSHALSLRYENADTPRFRRRETVTLEHGKLARQVLIMAENSGVEMDDGIIAALCQCAAVAGDMATAKAVYTAAQIRREMTHLRTIGSDEHLAQLRGEDIHKIKQKTLVGQDDSSNASALAISNTGNSSPVARSQHAAFTEREYGKDSRVLSTILLACSKAVGHRSLGSMWQGRENDGYFCINSLRLIAEPRKPRYTDDSIPGQTVTDGLSWEGEHRDTDPRKKFGGVYEDNSVAANIEELDDTFSKLFLDKDGERLPEFLKSTPEDIWELKYADKGTTEVNSHIAISSDEPQLLSAQTSATAGEINAGTGMYFDSNTMTWQTRSTSDEGMSASPEVTVAHTIPKTESHSASMVASPISQADKGGTGGMYFDYDTMKWKTRGEATSLDSQSLPMHEIETRAAPEVFSGEISEIASDSSGDDDGSDLVSDSSDDEESFSAASQTSEGTHGQSPADDFTESIEQELLKHSLPNEVNSDELSDMYFDKSEQQWKFKSGVSDGDSSLVTMSSESGSLTSASQIFQNEDGFQMFYTELKQMAAAEGEGDVNEEEARELFTMMNDGSLEGELGGPDSDDDDISHFSESQDHVSDTHAMVDDENELPTEHPIDASIEASDYDVEFSKEKKIDAELQELQEMLPTFSESRLRKVRDVFEKSLDNPPLLELIPVVRESMPDYISGAWLKKMSFLTAKFVAHQASIEGKLDIHILNGILELYASSGSLDNALDFHQKEFDRYGFSPTVYSDRLVLQMFLANNRFQRALVFKERIEQGGRVLDLKSYGSLIVYCSRRNQLGSGLLLAKECVSIHGAKPEEACLKELRLLSRKAGLTETAELESVVGEDPFKWVRYGEAKLKRESSKRGKRDVRLGENQLLRI